MNDDQVRLALHGSLDTLTPATRSLAPLRTAGRRRRLLRESALAVATVVVLGGSAVTLLNQGNDRSALQPADPTATPAASVVSDPQPVWDAFLADHPGAVHSQALVVKGAAYGAYAEDKRLHLLRYEDGWIGAAEVYDDFGASVTHLSLAVLTDGPGPDVVATTTPDGDEQSPTYVLDSDFRFLTFSCPDALCAIHLKRHVNDGKVVDGSFTSEYDPCLPSCSGGARPTVAWQYHSDTGQFQPADSGACAPSAQAGATSSPASAASRVSLWDVTDAALVNGLVRLTYQVDTVRCGTVDDVIYEPTGPTLTATLARDAHVEVLPPNGSPTLSVIAPDELPQDLLPGTHRTFEVKVSGTSVTSLVEQYHP